MGTINEFLGNLRVLVAALLTRPPDEDTPGSIAMLVEGHAAKHPRDVALICEEEEITWQALNERGNRVARVLIAEGVVAGDCVALFMQNRIDFVVSLIGIGKVGAIAGMINTNLMKQPLIHCINLVNSKKCIFGEELTAALDDVRDQLHLKASQDFLVVRDPVTTGSDTTPLPDWATALNSTDTGIDGAPLTHAHQGRIGDTACFIFTSGTTGLPKAAVVTFKRILPAAAMAADYLLRLSRTDRVYNCLPLYHGTGLMIGLIAAFHAGASTVIRRRLSVHAFWDDIRKYQCTSFVYIGEFIRYLMSQPPMASDRQNPIKSIVGNGLRPDIWIAFKARFGIDRIGEFYGASEGNGGFANVFNKDCTVGLGTAPVKLVRYDVAEDRMVLDANGHGIEVAAGEVGLLLIEVTKKSRFEGYTDSQASEKKLISDVLTDGDLYFNSGDLMKTIDVGFAFGRPHYQFVDRIGDTFRWKSENVSTNEVAELINGHPDVVSANVYGVEIPGADGRAGMAAIIFQEGFDASPECLDALGAHVTANLPSYARPVFVRIRKELPTTSTLKLQKNVLRDEAYHLDKVEDDLLVMKPGTTTYCRLDADFYDKIMQRDAGF